MIEFQTIFKSQDSKYFLKTASKITLVPFITTLFVAYTLWIYIELNYSFFIANGFASDAEMKEVFWDKLFSNQTDFLPWIGLFYVCVFFLGLFLSHLVMRPFSYVKNMCEDILKGEEIDSEGGFLNAQKILIRSSDIFVSYLSHKQQGKETYFEIPEDLEKINGPVVDKVFYLQYGIFMLALAIITSFAMHYTLHHIHEAIVETALSTLQGNKTVGTFLTSQQDNIDFIVYIGTALNAILYIWLARGIIKEIEGVSYSYLRDIRDISAGDHSRRLHPRENDPGQEAAFAINQVMNLFFKRKK
jgi:hypothetical protein